ncbi:hypothetical protein GVAV_000627 [Gurleya vavrai]
MSSFTFYYSDNNTIDNCNYNFYNPALLLSLEEMRSADFLPLNTNNFMIKAKIKDVFYYFYFCPFFSENFKKEIYSNQKILDDAFSETKNLLEKKFKDHKKNEKIKFKHKENGHCFFYDNYFINFVNSDQIYNTEIDLDFIARLAKIFQSKYSYDRFFKLFEKRASLIDNILQDDTICLDIHNLNPSKNNKTNPKINKYISTIPHKTSKPSYNLRQKERNKSSEEIIEKLKDCYKTKRRQLAFFLDNFFELYKKKMMEEYLNQTNDFRILITSSNNLKYNYTEITSLLELQNNKSLYFEYTNVYQYKINNFKDI